MATRTINDAKNPKWANIQKTEIDLEVDFDELDEVYVPFTASQNDPEAHGVELYNNAVSGMYGEIGDFDPPANVVGEKAMDLLRIDRNAKLSETDYIEMPTKWATLSDEQKASWSEYRNALRDLPANYPNAEKRWNDDYTGTYWHNVEWPIKPS